MLKTVYLGYSKKMLEYLLGDDRFKLLYVIANRNRVTEEFINYAKNNSFFINVEKKEEIYSLKQIFNEADIIIIYKFEYIIPQQLLQGNKIINFHGGDLRTNRGAHAVVWSVLKRESSTCLSCYELTGGIDEGILIDEYNVKIDRDDTVDIVNNKLVQGIPFLINRMYEYIIFNRPGLLICNGIYRRKIKKIDYTINIYNDTVDIIRGKILSQSSYFGAILLREKKECRIKNYENIHDHEYCKSKIIQDYGDRITILEEKDGICFMVE